MSTAVLRVKRALTLAHLDSNANLERITGAANEVWYAGDYVVRISSHPGTRRLEHEAAVARLLPEGARYPGIVSYGRAEFGEWLVMRHVPGVVLARAWSTMREGERRDAVYQVATALREVHQIKVGADNEALDRPPFLEPDSLECPHQLPLARLLRVIERARTLPYVDKGVLDQAERLARINAASLSGPPPEYLVHGDLHFENVLYENGQITALLDFEFARAGPPDLDLEIILRFCADPQLHVSADYAPSVNRDDYRSVLRWIHEAYPALFEHPALESRLNLYSLSYDLRDLVVDPPRKPFDQLPPYHAYRRLRRLLDGRGMLQLIEW
jgi:aminoglycoside phosphotransferase (APT) family kinase protein